MTISSTTSTDGYPDTTATASTLHEATDITSNDLSAETPSSKDVRTKLENLEEMSHGETTAVLPDENAHPLTPLPEANLHITL